MRKQDIITLVNCGILSMTTYDLKPAQAYKAFKLKREVEKAYKDIQDEQETIKKENGITEELSEKISKIIDKINVQTKVSEDEKQELLQYNELNRKINKLIEEAVKGDVAIDIKSMPFEDWRKLQEENKEKMIGNNKIDILGGIAEVILENILWDAPKDNE